VKLRLRTRAPDAIPAAWKPLTLLAAIALVAGSGTIVRGRPATVVPAGEASRESIAVEEREGEPGSNTERIVEEARNPARPGLACAAGRNGGSTDEGVTGTSIRLGATVVDSGIGASFLRDARYSMLAVANRVNRAGGICGRRLELELVDDEWDFQRGGQFIQNLVEGEKVFALAVVPSSEGLKNVSDSGYLARQGVPVVGSDGMLIHQYEDPYIWPVAASTISTMHIMAKHAYERLGARSFAIVYEHTYHFGTEGARAFEAAVRRLTGEGVPGYSDPLTDPRCERRFCGIDARASNFSTEVATISNDCIQQEPKCDFVALLLEPATALAWMKQGGLGPELPGRNAGGVQPLFTRAFAEECGQRCDGLWLWTGYDPPIGAALGRPAIARYVRDLQQTKSTVDFTNTFVEGAYIGMSLLVEAFRRVGPDLTRERLKDALDAITFRSGLTDPLRWRPGDHFANVRMRAYSIQYKGRFAGWRDELTTVRDPWVGMDIPER